MKFKQFFAFLLAFSLFSFFLPILPAKAETPITVCKEGNMHLMQYAEYLNIHMPVLEMPTYSYGADGLVRFHFKLDGTGWNGFDAYHFLYDQACEYQGVWGYGSSVNASNIPEGIYNLTAKAVESGPNYYIFKFYNQDTGEEVKVTPNFNHYLIYPPNPVIALNFSNYAGYFPQRIVTTPAVSIKISKTNKTPVLIIPGILGTEIFKGEEKLWPDILRMGEPNSSDAFMDRLAFLSDGSPLDSGLSLGSVLGRPTLKVDYTKSLVEDLMGLGYKPGEDLFTFPYDWRKDLDEIAKLNLTGQIDYILNQTNAGKSSGKIDIIAHSQGGLVIKRLLSEKPDYQFKINKLVFVGVPNLGAPKAAKALVFGDDLDIFF